jgi:ferredoxin
VTWQSEDTEILDRRRMEEAVKARVDRSLCIGSAMCVSIAPDVFELDNQGQSHAINPDPGDDDLLREVAESCPVLAIVLEDDEGNQVFP